jgi:hypothetical protein
VITPLLLRDLEQKLLRLKDGVSLEKNCAIFHFKQGINCCFYDRNFALSNTIFYRRALATDGETLIEIFFKFQRHAMPIKLTLSLEPPQNTYSKFIFGDNYVN